MKDLHKKQKVQLLASKEANFESDFLWTDPSHFKILDEYSAKKMGKINAIVLEKTFWPCLSFDTKKVFWLEGGWVKNDFSVILYPFLSF